MSGRHQHYIPRYFLKGFVAHKNAPKLHCYRRGKNNSFHTSTMNLAQERHFYSEPTENGDETLDDEITEYERVRFNGLLDEIREMKVGETLDSLVVAEVITHLMTRSAHTRNVIGEGVNALANFISDALKNPVKTLALDKVSSHKIPSKLADLITEKIHLEGLVGQTGVTAPTIARLLYFQLRERTDFLSSELDSAAANIQPFLDTLGANHVPKIHIDILSKNLVPEKRIEVLSGFKFQKHRIENAILPDCVCLAICEDDDWKPLFLAENHSVRSVVFAISSNEVIVGQATESQQVKLENYNYRAANSALDFFLATDSLDEYDAFLPSLGDKARQDMRALTKGAALHAVEGIIGPTIANNILPRATKHEAYNKKAASIGIQLIDAGNEEFAQKFGAALLSLINYVSDQIAFDFQDILSRIDKVTIASDYSTAVHSVSRDFEFGKELKPTDDEDAVGVLMPIIVVREGEPKLHLVVRDFLAEGLVSEDQELKNQSIKIIGDALVYLVHLDFTCIKFPNEVLKPIQNPLERFIYPRAKGIFEAYFTARNGIMPTFQFDEMETEIASLIASCISDLREVRQRYRLEGQLDELYSKTSDKAETVLLKIAKYLGLKHCGDHEMDISSPLYEQLESNDLISWIELFERDLLAFHDRLKTVSEFEEYHFQNRHFERLLAWLGIVVDENPANQIYLHVAYVEHLDRGSDYNLGAN